MPRMIDGPVEIVTLSKGDLWQLACEHDGIDPASPFVIFSDDNPYVRMMGSKEEDRS